MAKSKKNNVTSNESVSSDDQINDVSQAEVKKLISKGKEKGYLTYVELAKALSPEKFSSEKIEDIQAIISDLGISLVDSDDDYDVEAENIDNKEQVVKIVN
nr:RNA polymerase sigma factor RpoD [Pelagibacterales bacterium]